MSRQLIWNEGYDRRVEVLAGGLLTLPAVLSFALILHHPTLYGVHGLANLAASLRVMARLDGIVHGGLMLMYALQALGFFLFTSSLGWKRPSAAAGFMAYAAGVLLLTIPATLDGFVTPDLAAACVTSPDGCGLAEAGAFRFVAILIQDFTKVALVATAAATLCWSISLLFIKRIAAQMAGAVGLICAVAPAATIVLSNIYLQPGNLAGVILSQVIWSLVVAALMFSGALRQRDTRAATDQG